MSIPALDQQQFAITMNDWDLGTSDPARNFLVCDNAAGAQPDGVGNCTFEVTATYPESGKLYINLHLDYGFKGNNNNFNPIDGVVDRYDKGCVGDPLDAFVNNASSDADCSGGLALENCTEYRFSHEGDPTILFTDSTWNSNEFKKNPGVGGLILANRLDGSGTEPVVNQLVRLLDPRGVKVGEARTDEDGFYMITYKHKGKPTVYRVVVVTPAYSGAQQVTLKGNGFSEGEFTCDMVSNTCW